MAFSVIRTQWQKSEHDRHSLLPLYAQQSHSVYHLRDMRHVMTRSRARCQALCSRFTIMSTMFVHSALRPSGLTTMQLLSVDSVNWVTMIPSHDELTNITAVRKGSQLDLHRCISKMLPTKIDCYDRTRLFYLVCLCDHHCSLKYGRPPMTQDWRSLKSPKLFYLSEFSSPRDLGLVSLLKLWTIT
jgi:hypothetical protein